jgi:uncharacterized metal-binding protein YceD (DUF177 family)
MKVHLRQIPTEGLHLEGEESAEILEPGTTEFRAVSPIRYALDIGLSEGGLFATGTLAVDMEFECVTCLRKFVRTITVDDFALQLELTGAETVDLTEPVREDILLALPPHPHCDWDATRECEGVKPVASEPLPEQNVWEELDKLKIRKTK